MTEKSSEWFDTRFAHYAKFSEQMFQSFLANAAGENSSVIFTVCVKSVPRYHFKLAYVVLHMAVK